MIRFAELYHALDSTTKTNDKIAAMKDYFTDASPADAAWAVHFLSGKKLKQPVPRKLLRRWAADEAGIPSWLFDESYHAVGDLAEAMSLVVPQGESTDDRSLTSWIEDRLMPLREMNEDHQRQAVIDLWRQTPALTRLVVMKLITGGFRVGVSKRLVTRSVALASGIAPEVVAHRLMGNWEPTAEFFLRLTDPDAQDTIVSQPYPFCLAHPLDPDAGPKPLGDIDQYVAEWKWDGIRGQVIRRSGQTFIWSRGEDLMENRWPEIEAASELLPDGTVLDGEILACLPDGEVLSFGELQRRIGRKTVGKKLLTEVPVVFHAFDLLEHGGRDVRELPFSQRREQLQNLLCDITHPNLRITELIPATKWQDWQEIRQTSRERNSEGLMLKRKDAVYDVGRVRGTWWKWKVAPYTIDAVLIYAQKGHGKRASLFTDYTFALWDGEALVPFAKAYSGLDDAEIRKVDHYVRRNTKEKFGPVRSVTPTLVMELAFEGLQKSKRHKSGIATRFPRILRWRHDKNPKDANSLDELLELLPE
ncbi:ATP-dependent DNA ligase [Planctomycetes bacterium K23_9]|uniref:DNA ligase (ATP) n=1 Tax=Stieleria marina TaxID=1930275 RepID=A0A517NQ75_9BACT|nr:Putative DNA ligase-like protein [Planctomycetes bacterium K23_9]